MLKIIKWIYELGIRHERRRIKLLIAQHRHQKPEKPNIIRPESRGEERQLDAYHRDLDIWTSVGCHLDNLIEPKYHEQITMALLDED